VETDTIVRAVTADRGDAGRRLDLVLMRQLTGLRGATRTRLQRWIEDGRVELNGRQVRRAATRTNAGDSITVLVPIDAVRASSTPHLDGDPAAAGALDVLFEDEHLLAVNKPAGIVVHPTYKHTTGR
jgi:23S rRNA pseudouridine1911/1915/1917 synthase